MDKINYMQPKFQEIARRQAKERLEAELAQKRANRMTGGNRNRYYG